MDEDSKIRVLHYHNPHLMWVEVKNVDTYTLRQVGLFGVVPRQASFIDGERVCTKSEHWDPRVNEIVEEFLEAKHLSFKSTYRLDDDKQSSIFGDHPHIFGEIYSVRKGVKKQLSSFIDNSMYAYKSKSEFWQMLEDGRIKTQLDNAEEMNVLESIVTYYKDKGLWQRRKEVFNNLLSPTQLSKIKMETASPKLTMENLQKHHILSAKTNHPNLNTGIPKVRESPARKKYQDFNCNQELAAVEFVEDAIKRFTVTETPKHIVRVQKTDSGTDHSEIVVYDEELNPQLGDEIDVKDNQKINGRANTRHNRTHSTNSSPLTPPKVIPTATSQNKAKFLELLKLKEKLRQSNMNHTAVSVDLQNRSGKSSDSGNVQKARKPQMLRKERSEDEDSYEHVSPISKMENRFVAYGPPVNNKAMLVRKLVTTRIVVSPPKLETSDALENVNEDKIDWECEPKCSNLEDISHKSENDGVGNDLVIKSKKVNLKNAKDNDNVHNGQGNVKHRHRLGHENVREKENSLSESEQKEKNIARKFTITQSHYNTSSNDQVINDYKANSTQPNTINTDSDDDLETIQAKLNSVYVHLPQAKPEIVKSNDEKINVNPYKNEKVNQSIFVDNLIQPLLLVHAKNNNRIIPQGTMRDIPFNTKVSITLRNMQIKVPSRLQSVSWQCILRGHSVFMISPSGSGKTLGYVPAVCNLVSDYNFGFAGLGPICIIVCATAVSVTNVAKMCRMFINNDKVISCFPGLDNKKLVTDLVNGCNILVSTPSMLYRLLGAELGVDLRRLTTIVFDDCEYLADVYELEVKAVQMYIKQMLKFRTYKQVKVQYILASRKWCDMMSPLAKKSPDTVVMFTAFHECVLYSKSPTSVSFVKREKKVDAVIEFLKETDDSKLAVIVCRSDDEVKLLETTLTSLNYKVVACNNEMTIHDLYKIRTEDLNSILVCCDGNLKHLNVTHAKYLVHFSMPPVYTQFCARFSVLNDNYPSIFEPVKTNVKIKILLEETNVEQLPKILNFVKRCSENVPEFLNEVARKVLEQKDLERAESFVPICDSVLSLGECVNMENCQCRHLILHGCDEPKAWMPTSGVITFKIIHYHTATSYSARLITHVFGSDKKKYPETYGTLCLKLGMYYSNDKNKRLHGEPKPGDICAVSARQNFIARCQVLKILSYERGKVKSVIINLIDEEKIQIVNAVDLYFLPETFKNVETHVVRVQLAGVRPQDKDVTFSDLAMDKLKNITFKEEQLYLKSKVDMTIGQTIFVSTLEACAELSALNETVVKYDFKKMLLDAHAIPHPDHLLKLQKLCDIGNLKVKQGTIIEPVVPKRKPVKNNLEYRWAHLPNYWADVIFSNVRNPGKFYVRLDKFSKCINSLVSDINKYVQENPEGVETVEVKDVVLAEFPDDSVYERAIVEEIIDDTKVTCFFVDNADWRDVAISKLKPIPQKFIKQIPFQSIECHLIGVKPPRDDWTEFSTNWLYDNCLDDESGKLKKMYVKYFTKEYAEQKDRYKYGVVLVDTTTDDDVVINKRMIELNLVAANKSEREYLQKPLDFVRENTDTSTNDDDLDELEDKQDLKINFYENRVNGSKNLTRIPIKLIPNEIEEKEDWTTDEINNDKVTPYVAQNGHIDDNKVPLKKIFAERPIRSVPLVNDSDEDLDKWDVCLDENLGKAFGVPKLSQSYNRHKKNTDDDFNDFTAVTTTKDEEESVPILPAITNICNADRNLMKKVKIANEDAEEQPKNIKENENSLDEKIDTALLKGEIKDVSFYDSDDTLSITTTNDKTEITKELTKNPDFQPSVLDSDDTQSITTDISNEISFGKGLNKSVLDSDDSEVKVTDVKDTDTPVTKPWFLDIYNGAKKLVGFNDINRKIGEVEVKTESTGNPMKEVKAEFVTNEIFNTYVEKEMNIEQVKDKAKEREDTELRGKTITVTQTTVPCRTPQLIWKQQKNTITIKIKVVVDEYTLESGNRSLKFSAYQNEIKYAFDIELYGVIECEKTKHANKGQYILVTLAIMLKKTTRWIRLTKEFTNWILYDVDSIDTSSDEEPQINDDALKIIMDKHEKSMDIDDDDMDDVPFRYRD